MDSSSLYVRTQSQFTDTSGGPRIEQTASPNIHTTSEHTSQLAHFPPELRAHIAAHFPTLNQLQAFHQIFIDKGIPTERAEAVAFVLEATLAKRQDHTRASRYVALNHGPNLMPVDAYDADGATSLHKAILAFDLELTQALLRSGASPSHVLMPTQREREGHALIRMGAQIDAVCDDHARQLIILNGVFEAANPGGGIKARVLAQHAGENALTLAISYDAPLPLIALLAEYCLHHCPHLLTQPDDNGQPPVVLAAACDRLDVIRLLLQPGSPVHADQLSGLKRSALMEAARRGNTDMATFLLQNKANHALTDKNGSTARELAALCCQPSVYQLLSLWEDQGASRQSGSEVQRNHQLLADFYAAVARQDPIMVSSILTHQKNRLGAAGIAQALSDAVRIPGNGAVIRCLLEQGGAAPDDANVHGVRPDMQAADVEAYELLMDTVCPADPGAFNTERRQAMLLRAAALGSIKYVCYALSGGADINAKDALTQQTALATAIQRNDRPVIAELLERGAATVSSTTTTEDSALAIAAKMHPPTLACELIRFILNQQAALYLAPQQANALLVTAIHLNMPDLVARLVSDGRLQWEQFHQQEASPLLLAVQARSAEALACLLKPPAPVRQLLAAPNGHADAAMALAVEYGEPKMVEVILRACEISEHDERTALMRRLFLAIDAGSETGCALIFQQGKLVLPRTAPENDNALVHAIDQKHYHLLPVLLQNGGHSCAVHDDANLSPLGAAAENSDARAVEVLLRHDPHVETELDPILTDVLEICTRNDDCLTFEALIAGARDTTLSQITLDKALRMAVQLGSTLACQTLLVLHANPDYVDGSGHAGIGHANALGLAVTGTNTEIIRLLFRHSATTITDASGSKSLLQFAFKKNQPLWFALANPDHGPYHDSQWLESEIYPDARNEARSINHTRNLIHCLILARSSNALISEHLARAIEGVLKRLTQERRIDAFARILKIANTENIALNSSAYR